MKTLLFAALALSTSLASAMPHDQPELHFYSDKTTAVGLVFSEGTNYTSDPKAHRLLQQVYVCQNGKLIANALKVKALADSEGALVIAKEKTGGSITIEDMGAEIWIMSSNLKNLKLESTDVITLKKTISGVSDFEVDWSKPCQPVDAN